MLASAAHPRWLLPDAPLLARNYATTEILFWVFLLIVLIIAGGLAVVALRRRLLSDGNAVSEEAGLMNDMRAMHARGELTDDEYNTIRKRLAVKAAERIDESARLKAAEAARAKSAPVIFAGENYARPGYDLTGAPLPKAHDSAPEASQAPLPRPQPRPNPRPESTPNPDTNPGPSPDPDHDEDGFPKPR